jgi:hypothetical protein
VNGMGKYRKGKDKASEAKIENHILPGLIANMIKKDLHDSQKEHGFDVSTREGRERTTARLKTFLKSLEDIVHGTTNDIRRTADYEQLYIKVDMGTKYGFGVDFIEGKIEYHGKI